ncbi:MAG TPA: Gfo/Idh/MocA family oxidoreductase [Pseudogracilibacillus sp.]|nr:Gfo/Idh/MocA family oxidoreductase [Pseudogracilibacillus sp.]
MKKVRWGILSTARIAVDQLIPAIKKASNAKVTAIATSSDTNKVTTIAEQFHIEKVYSSYEDLLNDPQIDAVYIPLPNHLHKEWTIRTAKKGKHILCEKPAALNAKEVAEMKQACLDNDVLFMEAFMYYFHPQHERVKEIIDSGEIGKVTYMEAGFSFYLEEEARGKDIRMQSSTGGGCIYDLGCYTIHAIRNILRNEPESIHVHADIHPIYNVDTDVVAYLTFSNDLRATFNLSFNLPMRHEYRVYGTEGSIIVPRAFRPDLHGGEAIIKIKKSSSTRIETINGDQYRKEVAHLSQAILDRTNHVNHDLCNTEQNIKVIDASLDSIRMANKIML